jgi:acyl-CoA thioesterase-1
MRLYLLFLLTFLAPRAFASDVSDKADQNFKVKKILILGDSLTEGYGVKKEQAFPFVLESLLNKTGDNYKVLAAGTSGSTSASALKRLKWHLKANPDVLVLALGGNDGLRGIEPEATKSNLSQAIELAKNKGLLVVLAGMKTPTNYGEEYRERFESTFSELSKKHEVHLIPFLLKGVATVKDLNLADGIHPNEKGHKVIAKTLFESLKEMLKNKDKKGEI